MRDYQVRATNAASFGIARSTWAGRLGMIGLGGALIAFAVYCATHSVDFPIYHNIAAQILRGNYELYPPELYDGRTAPAHGFRYAPAIAFLFVPFGLLPLRAAAFLFFALKVCAFVYVGVTVARWIGLGDRRMLLLTSLLLVGGYVVEEFRNGNFHFFSVALMVLAFDSAASRRVVTPAAALGIAIAAKLTPILLLGYFALRRRWAVCAATVIVLVLLAVLPAALVGRATNERLLTGFVRYTTEKIDEGSNYALRGVLIRYLRPESQANRSTALANVSADVVSLGWVLAVIAAAVVVTAALWREPAGSVLYILEFSVVLTAILLASPHTQRQHLIALYVPVVALVALLTKYPELPERTSVRVALVVTGAASTVLPLVFGGRRLSLAYESWSPYFFATLALFVTLIFLRVRFKAENAGF